MFYNCFITKLLAVIFIENYHHLSMFFSISSTNLLCRGIRLLSYTLLQTTTEIIKVYLISAFITIVRPCLKKKKNIKNPLF